VAVFLAAGQKAESANMNQLLDCWISHWNASALKERLVAQLGEQRLQPDRLWNIIKATDGTWASWRRLVLLEAYGEYPGGMPDDRRVPWQCDMGICLLESGQYEDARQVFQISSTHILLPVMVSISLRPRSSRVLDRLKYT
jgi:hypothetical protein